MKLHEAYDEDIIQELERRGYEVFKKNSRNWDEGTLRFLLCNRYNVNYHTKTEKLEQLVRDELAI
jgi:hypothetical protein